MGLNIGQIAGDMLQAAAGAAKDSWKQIKNVAVSEIRHLARRVVFIAKSFAGGDIDREEAEDAMAASKANLISLLATLTALAAAAIQKIVNAALGAVKAAVNGFIGFALI